MTQTATHIEIFGGIVTDSTTVTAHGHQRDDDEIGNYRFFVDLVEAGENCTLWDGSSYEEAIIEAEKLSRDCGASVSDLVVGGAP